MTNNCIDEPSRYVATLPKLGFKDNTSVLDFDGDKKIIYFYNGKLHNGRIYSSQFEKDKWKKTSPLKSTARSEKKYLPCGNLISRRN